MKKTIIFAIVFLLALSISYASFSANIVTSNFTETDTLQSVTDRGSVTSNNITANAFIVDSGLNSEFLKADGSLDNTEYLDKSGDTMQGRLVLHNAYDGGRAPLQLPNFGTVNPTVIESGDIWFRSNALFFRAGSTNRQVAHTTQWAAMSSAEGIAGTATTSRLMRADRLKEIIEHYVNQGGFVPYVGATQNVDLGSNNLKALNVEATGKLITPDTIQMSNNINIGDFNTVTGFFPTGIGYFATSTGNLAISIGLLSSATAEQSTAIGANSVANGLDSIAVGGRTGSSAIQAISIGRNSDANKIESIAIGIEHNINGEFSVGIGNRIDINHNRNVVLGSRNIHSRTNNSILLALNDGSGQKDLLHAELGKGVRIGDYQGETVTMTGKDLFVAGHIEAKKGYFGNSSLAILGDDANNIAGFFDDGTTTVSILDGFYGIDVNSGSRFATIMTDLETAFFDDGNNYVSIADGFNAIYTEGDIYANDFITLSRVADFESESRSLDKLSNVDEWTKNDGSLNYDKHYAVINSTRYIQDDNGLRIVKFKGLSMENRIAEMEKMIWELKHENIAIRTRLTELESLRR